MTERELQRQIVKIIKKLNLKYYAVSNSRKVASTRGWPDIFAVGPRGVRALELKVNANKVRKEQVEWLKALNEAGVPAMFIWPEDLESGKVEAELDAISAPATP